MTLPIAIAEKLRQLLVDRTSLPASDLKGVVVEKMFNDGVLQKRLIGKSKAVIFITDTIAFQSYLANHFGVADIEEYVKGYRDENITRSQAIAISGNSKLRNVRTFKGFMVSSYAPVDAILNGRPRKVSHERW